MRITSLLIRKLNMSDAAVGAVICTILLTGCGIGMDNEDRLQRASVSFSNSEYRATIIDTRRILQTEPDNVRARILLGRALFQTGEIDSSIKELDTAIGLGADSKDIVVDLGRALLSAGQYDRIEAEMVLELAANDDARLQLLKIQGDALMAQSQPVLARANYREVVVQHPHDVDAQLAIVLSFIAEGDLDEARMSVNQLIVDFSSNFAVHMTSAQLWLLQGDAAQAETNFRAAYAIATELPNPQLIVGSLIGIAEAQLQSADSTAASVTVSKLEEMTQESSAVDFLAARVFFMEQDWSNATSKLKDVLRAEPNHGSANMLLGAIQLQRGNVGQAEAYLTMALAEMPDDAFSRRLLAETRLRQSNPEEAAMMIEPLLADNSINPVDLAIAARVSVAEGDFERATKLLQARSNEYPENNEFKVDLALFHLMNGDIGQAEEILRGLDVSSERDLYKRDLLLVLASVRAGDLDDAENLVADMRAQWPNDERIILLSAGVQRAAGDLNVARRSFLEALEINPESVAALVGLARLDIQDGDLGAAHEHLIRAHELEPSNTKILVALGRIEFSRVNLAEAAAHFETALELDPENLEALSLLGQAHLLLDDFEASEHAFNRYLRHSPEDTNIQFLLAQCYQQSGSSGRAVELYENIALNDPSNFAALNNAAWLLFEQGNPRAVEVARNAVAVAPTVSAVNDTLGWVLTQNDLANEGVNYLRTAYELDNASTEIKYHLAFALAETGQSGEAKQLLAELLESTDKFDERTEAANLLAQL